MLHALTKALIYIAANLTFLTFQLFNKLLLVFRSDSRKLFPIDQRINILILYIF